MDFELTEQQNLLKKSVRTFLEKELAPLVEEYERKIPFPKELAQEVFDKLSPFGYLDGPIPVEYGGQGLDFLSWGILLEELARVWAGPSISVAVHTIPTRVISLIGSDYLKKIYIPPLLRGGKILCVAITEPEAGSNVTAMQTSATPQENYFLVEGTKTWISNGTFADLVFLLAVDKSFEEKSFSLFLIDKEISPFEARDLPKLGIHSCGTAELRFDGCKIPQEHLIGKPGEGYRQALITLGSIRICVGSIATGIAQAALDASIKYAKERVQFGKPIGSFQFIQEMIVEMLIEIEAAHFFTYRAWWLTDKGERSEIEASIAKAYTTEAAIRVTSRAIQIHGAYGLSKEYPLERYFRDARCLTIPDGTTEIMKLIIGRRILDISAIA